ncbi:Tripartite ATP-independent periplasmic transporter DctQ component [Desulfovibrio sp. X2]|uniref:TRAP transporter small permease n=1 Tax=Desulfovibrio sp. X2 TaxID=941449 RepID=UPI000358A881|nr:TRAP transporter small permease [Desulfovibrio sp. X2]EPR43691.1 Tripartite ATP-independent periplasmic transporter DctQ component [Desulfovibrio sp. X2]
MIARLFNSLEEGVIILLLAAMTLLVFVEVILRFVFNTGLLWAEELTLAMSAWMVLFGASYGIKVGSHIGVDAAIKAMPRGARRVVTGVAICCGLAYCVMIIYGAFIYAQKMHSIGLEMQDLPVPRWLSHGVPLIVGFALIGWRLLALLWKVVRGEAESFALTDEAKDSMRLVEEARRAAGEPGGDEPGGNDAGPGGNGEATR